MQIIKKLFCSHFSVNKGLIQHVVQSCYNYNITFRKLEIHTVKMRPISACYTSGRGARHFLDIGRCTIKKRREFNRTLFTCFVGYTNYFNSHRTPTTIGTVMREMGFPKRIVSLIEALYSEQQSAVRTDSGTTDWLIVSKGVRQGCITSPQLFSVYTDSIMREVKDEQSNSEYDELSVGGTKIT